MNLPLVSIIIPVFNRATILKDTLDSIVNQTYANWECLIVDDGSTDETKTVIQKYAQNDSRIIGLERPQEKNKGANACRNYGLSAAKGDYIVFFDSDDIMAPTCLERRVQAFTVHQDKDMLIFSMGVFKEDLKFEVYPFRKVVNLSVAATLEEFVLSDTLPWNVCRPIFKSNLIKDKVEFNEKIQNFQDEEFNIRVLGQLKPEYLSIDETDTYYRFDQASQNKYKTLKGTQDIVDCFYEFYATVFSVFNEDQKKRQHKKLKLKFFNHVRFYAIPGINRTAVFQTMQLFKKELGFTFKETAIIDLMLLLNKYYYQKRGYHFVSTKLKEMMLK